MKSNPVKRTKKTGKLPTIRKNARHKAKRLEARADRKAENEAARAPKPIEPLHSKSRGTSNTKPRRHGFLGGTRAGEPGDVLP